MVKKDDNELVYEVIKGSVSSFEVLIDRYQQTIFNLLVKMVGDKEVARDLTQDVFVKAFEKLGGFNFNHRFFSWIYRIAINEAINWRKKRPPVEPLPTILLESEEGADEEERDRRSRLLHKGLRLLTDDHRTLLLLRYYCGMSYEEIAEVTRLPERRVKSRLFSAREKLHDYLIKLGFFEHE